MKFVVEHANFCPRVVTIPDEDVPQDILNILLNSSDDDGMIVMEYDNHGNYRQRKDTEANKIAHILLTVHDNLTSPPGYGYDVPKWTKNATLTKHRSFNTAHLIEDSDFYFIEDWHLDDHNEYIEPVYNNVDELLRSYVPSKSSTTTEHTIEDDTPPSSPETDAPTD